ncbi:hypothetical protein EXIGLDRAFT_736513 [Exidia glandulosa HHB12029]|uniref:Uncharacterized protein n=1 Tax=Exidia glandulosa HHB12029 TaxID=1314781 RepID=A0A165JBS4_EXIGL|nr:hypothetical protein EXIGLDRAFT_736513 [Exidia glandulosa HHB12029]
MGNRVRHGIGFITDPAWRKQAGKRAGAIQTTIEDFCKAMDVEESRAESSSHGLHMVAASQSATDGAGMNRDPAYKLHEWQVDGAY